MRKKREIRQRSMRQVHQASGGFAVKKNLRLLQKFLRAGMMGAGRRLTDARASRFNPFRAGADLLYVMK